MSGWGQSGRLLSAALIASRTLRLDATSLDWRYPAKTSCIWNDPAATVSNAHAHAHPSAILHTIAREARLGCMRGA